MAFNLKRLVRGAEHGVSQAATGAIHQLLGRPQAPVQQQSVLPSNLFNQAGDVPNVNNPLQNPTSLPRLKGVALTEGTADAAGYTPAFKSIVQGLNPAVVGTGALQADYLGPRAAGPGGDFNGSQIKVSDQAPDAGTILTHEGIHGANAQSPDIFPAYGKLLAAADPRQQRVLAAQARNSNEYGGNSSGRDVADESLAYGSGMALQNNHSPLANIYSQYFRSRDPHSFSPAVTYAPMIARDGIDRLLHLGDYSNYKPQFSDWRNN